MQNTPDYSLNGTSNPAPAGSTIVAYLTGTGPVSPAAKDGVPTGTTVLTNATSAVTAKIGDADATVSFTGLTPGFIGLAQMNIVVPRRSRPEFIRWSLRLTGRPPTRLRSPLNEDSAAAGCCPPVLRSKNMLFEADKVMFEIYRETEYTGKYRVCYFTELQDHNKESEINHALAGEHFFDGFIKNFRKDEAKEIIASLLGRLNNGEQVDAQEVERALGDHMA